MPFGWRLKRAQSQPVLGENGGASVLGLILAALALAGCKTLPHVPDALVAEVTSSRGYLTGAPSGLHEPSVFNAEDFVYDLRLSPDSSTVALSRLGAKYYFFTTWNRTDVTTPAGDVQVNGYEFDVEAIDWSPDGSAIATVSKDGAVRVFDPKGKILGAWLTEEPLVSVAFHPSGKYLAVGSRKGLVTVLQWPGLAFAHEVRAHSDEVRALAFADDGTLFSASWDRSIGVFSSKVESTAPGTARVRFERKGGLALIRGSISDRASSTFVLDARLPAMLVVKPALAQVLGLDLQQLKDEVTLPTAFGPTKARLAHGVRLGFKGLRIDNLDVAVCEACVAPDAQAALGQFFTDAFDVAFDEVTQEAVIVQKGLRGETQGQGAQPTASLELLQLAEKNRFKFPASVNDLSIDRSGSVLGVAFSDAKGERSREVYEREKRGEVEPEREWDCGARVDAKTGAVLEKKHGHRGVVSTTGISPDGKTLATGGWDKQLILHGSEPVTRKFGWLLRKIRFSRDGRWLSVAAWTPQTPIKGAKSDPSGVVYELAYPTPAIAP